MTCSSGSIKTVKVPVDLNQMSPWEQTITAEHVIFLTTKYIQ